MPSSQYFKNNGQVFEIHLDKRGRLHFKANFAARTRMMIDDKSGTVTIGGSGGFGQLQLKDDNDENTIFLGREGTEAIALLGGLASSQHGRIKLFDAAGLKTVDLNGKNGKLTLGTEGQDGNLSIKGSAGIKIIDLDGDESQLKLFSSAGAKKVELQGEIGRLRLFNGSGVVTAELLGSEGNLTLGGTGTDGDIFVRNGQGNNTISCVGDTGIITCGSLTETSPNLTERSNGRLKAGIAPLMNALDSVLALRGVRYQRKQVTEPTATATGDAQQIGFVGQEMEAVCPELVTTDAKGVKTVSYSRMTVVLVEAIKEQQQLIRDQAAALDEALGKISAIEAGLASHR